jgi:uncharacterized protein (TIGR03067 family)
VKPLRVLAAVLFLPLLGFDAPPPSDGETAFDPLEGSWSEVEITRDGKLVRFEPEFFHFQSGKVTQGENRKGIYRFDQGQTPARLEMTFSSGACRTWRCLARLDGDSLKIAWLNNVGTWPPDFEGREVYISTFRRLKK